MAFLDTLKALPLRKKIIAGAAALSVVGALALLAKGATTPPMALLYAGMDQTAAGEILSKLDGEAVSYKIEGDRIYVPAPERDRLRLTLASQGLPRQSVAGYELLDDLSGFSTTSDMFSAAYWRAKEGELVRTVMTIPGVNAARVHIGTNSTSIFARNGEERSVSVTLTAPGGLSSSQVKAIQHMAALAVANVAPADVAVIDTGKGLLTGQESDQEAAATDEVQRARALERQLTSLLEARVGPGNARVTVALELSRERQAISEQTVDPDTQVAIAREVSESRSTESGTDAAVTVASDLPDGDAAAGGAERQSQRQETSESIEYAVSTRDRTIEILPGQIEKLNVAVLINHLPNAEDGSVGEARPATEIAALRELVETAAGIEQARGDRLSIQTMAFELPEAIEAEAEAGMLAKYETQLWQMGQLALLGVVALLLGLLVVKPIMANGAESAAAAELAGTTLLIEDPVTMLRTASDEEPDAAAALLNAWLQEEETA